jgi:hypothetical protein
MPKPVPQSALRPAAGRPAAAPAARSGSGIAPRLSDPTGAVAAYARARTPRAAPPSGRPVVQRVIRVGGLSRSWQEWQRELDPDNVELGPERGDAARYYAVMRVLQSFDDGPGFASLKDFMSATAAATAPLEKSYREKLVARAEQRRAEAVGAEPEPAVAEDDRDPDDAPADDESYFPSRGAAFEYLAEKTSYTMEQLAAFEEFKPSVFEFLSKDIGPADIKLREWKKTLASVEYLFDHQPAVGTGKKSKGDWALSPIRKAALDVVAASKDDKLFPGGAYTVHHKVSRFKLRGLHTAMTKDPSGSARLSKVLHATGPETSSDLNALLNIPGNLEVGPQARVADPGAGFDPNWESGAMTPRSRTLNDIDTLIDRPAIDFDEVAKRLLILHKQQQEALARRGGTLITMPIRSQWTPGGSNKFKRG